VSDWFYVTLAFAVVWGGLAMYALMLARRVTQAGRIEQSLRSALREDQEGSDAPVCDAPPAP
jgi:CcmD family protein